MPRRLVSLGLAVLLAAFMLILLGIATRQAAAAALAAPNASSSNTYPGPNCAGTLQACINGTSAPGVVNILSGAYVTSVTLNRAISLMGAGSSSTIFYALPGQRVITVTGATITGSTVISGLTFAGGNVAGATCPAGCGGAVMITGSATPLLSNLVISHSTAQELGGGLYANTGSPLTLSFVTLISNTSTDNSGGGAFVAEALFLDHDFVLNNRALFGAGGGLRAGSSVNMDGGSFQNNHAFNPGGAMRATGNVNLNFGFFSGNTAGVVVPNASPVSGGALDALQDVSIHFTQFTGNTSNAFGGGVWVHGNAEVSNPLFDSNQAATDGGGLGVLQNITLTGFDFVNNLAVNGNGGGLYVVGSLTGIGGAAVSNQAGGQGGGAWVQGSATLSGTQIQDNQANAGAGGLFVSQTATLSRTQFLGNTTFHGNGGGLLVGSSVSDNGGLYQQNRSGDRGGGIYITGTSSLQSPQFISNVAAFSLGGGLFALGPLTISGGSFIGNIATNAVITTAAQGPASEGLTTPAAGLPGGGGLFAQGSVSSTNNLFQDNHATGNGIGGGAVFGSGSTPALSLGDRFISNTAGSRGGGLEANGPLTISRDVFEGNVGGESGGLDLRGSSSLVANSLFAGNVVSTSANGPAAAVRLSALGPAFLLNDTLANQTPMTQSAVVATGSSSPVFVTDTIISGYGVALSGTTIAEDFNLFFDNGADLVGALSGGHSLFGKDPRFANAAGGDFHLTAGSPAIDAGVDVGLRVDFDGDPRPLGAGFDIGFDEATFRLFLPLVLR